MPVPFQAAIRRLDSKSPVASRARTAQWASVPIGLRERAQFSAGVNKLGAINAISGKLREALDFASRGEDRAFMDRGKFVEEMRGVMQAHGLDTGKSGLTNPASRRRLQLIYDFQMEDAYEHGRWKTGQDPDILDEFPAQELLRIAPRNDTRDWHTRWREAGGQTYGGRMIALKSDPIWTRISHFGRPWPPFDFGSGMGLEEIDRAEAEDLGVIRPGETVPPQDEDFNAGLEQSLRDLAPEDPAFLQEQFGDQVILDGDRAAWVGSGKVLQDAFQRAISGERGREILLGRPLDSVRQRFDMRPDAQKAVTPDDLAHIHARHGEGNETAPDQIPVTPEHMRLVGELLERPDTMTESRGQWVFRRDFAGIGSFEGIVEATPKRLRLKTLYIKGKRPPSLTSETASGNQPPAR